MGVKRKYEDYKYVSVDVIRRASRGDRDALSAVIARYQNYGRKCFRTIAARWNLDIRKLPMDDLMQEVWIDLARLIEEKFEA